jgi:hypothetical protein
MIEGMSESWHKRLAFESDLPKMKCKTEQRGGSRLTRADALGVAQAQTPSPQ